MTKNQVALPLAIVGVSIAGALAGTWAVLMPEKLGLALAGGLTVPVLWGLLEFAAKDGKASIRMAVAAGAAIIALFLGLRVAQALQWLGPDEGKLSIRLFGMTSGLVLAFFGNRIPKMLERFDPTIDAARRQAFQRMAGWVFVLTGLAAAAIWLVLPVDHAKLWATLAVAAGTLLVVAQVVRCHFRGKNA